MRRALIAVWVVLLGLAVLAGFEPIEVYILFLVSPFAAIGTAVTVARRDTCESQHPVWRAIYRVVLGGATIASLVGIVASAAQILTDYRGVQHHVTRPICVLFLLGLIFAWRALVRPSPRGAALLALVIHVSWIPLVIIDMFTGLDLHPRAPTAWHALEPICMLAVLALSALAALLALASFSGEPPAIARAALITRGRTSPSR